MTSDNIRIVDDGTLDAVVKYKDTWHRYSQEYRNSFENDDEFLESVKDDIDGFTSRLLVFLNSKPDDSIRSKEWDKEFANSLVRVSRLGERIKK